jgi:hypothetical protein
MMRTQSIDTHPKAERVLIKLIRQAPMTKRFRLVQSLSSGAYWPGLQRRLARHPEMSEQEAMRYFLSQSHGPEIAQTMRTSLEHYQDWHLEPIDLMEHMHPALEILENAGIPAYLGGSIASSLHGMQQLAQDIDIVVKQPPQALSTLLSKFKSFYIFNENATQKAFLQGTSFSLFHQSSLIKVDLIFQKATAFDQAMHPLVNHVVIDERYPPLRIASATEMILFKLQRYVHDKQTRQDGMEDDAEWNDILGMLKVQGHTLDLNFLETWSRTLNIGVAWQHIGVDAGLIQA